MTAHVAYASTNKTKIVPVETELLFFFFFFSFFFTRGGRASCLCTCLDAMLLPQSYWYPSLSEGTDRVGAWTAAR